MSDLNELLTIARTWLGTPFRDDCAVRGRGVDCKNLVVAIVCQWRGVEPDYRALTGGCRRVDGGPVREYLEHLFPQNYVVYGVAEAGAMQAGDVLVFQGGNGVAHLGLALSKSDMIHVRTDRGVIISRLDQAIWQRRLVRIYRWVDLKEESCSS